MKRSLFYVLILALVALPAVAQQQYGSISGAVVDTDGQALPGVTVSLAGPAMQGSRTAVTDSEGRFRFVPVPPGSEYTVAFALSGFNTLERTGLSVNIGKDTAVEAEMSLSQFAETVTVTADRVVVDTTKSTVDTTVEWELVDTLPTNRNYQSMMEMAPGVRDGNNPYVSGGSNSSNIYMVDGVDTTDPRVQTWGTAINWDTIAEAQLQTGGFQAEYGRATGGILNLVTKSGGNNFSFTGRLVKSNADWSAKNGVEDETGQNKSGGSRTDEERPSFTLGGPIFQDRLWFYGAYEVRDNSRGYSWYPTIGDVATGNLAEGRTSYAGHYASGKLTWQVNPSHNVVAYYNEDPITLSPLRRGWSETSVFHFSEPVEQEQFQGGNNGSLQWTGVLTPNFFVEAKFQRTRQELNVNPDSPTWNQVPYTLDLNANYRYGGPWYDYQSRRNRDGYTLSGSYFLDSAHGTHQMKGGVEFLDLSPEAGRVYNSQGYYRMRGDLPIYRDVWVDQSGLKPSAQDYYALYFQDQWRVGNLTLNLGVRAEQTEIFNNVDDSLVKFSLSDQIAPRLGFAYDLNGDVIRGSLGRFYEMASNYIADYFQEIPDRIQRSWWNGTCDPSTGNYWEFGDECWDLQFDLPLAGGNATIDPNLEPAFVDEMTVGFDKRLSDQMAGTVTFIWRQQDTAVDWYDPEGSGYYYITNIPAQARADGYDVTDKVMEYQALEIGLRKRFGPDGFQFLTNYTYAIKDNAWLNNWRTVGSFTFTAPEFMAPNWYGRSGPKHWLKFNGSYTMPWKTVVGASAFWHSGFVYTPLTYDDELSPFGLGYPLQRRGSLNVGSNWEANLYVEQPVRVGPVTLALYANVFQLFNNQQPTARSGNSDLASFKDPTAWQNPRQIQLGFKIEY